MNTPDSAEGPESKRNATGNSDTVRFLMVTNFETHPETERENNVSKYTASLQAS